MFSVGKLFNAIAAVFGRTFGVSNTDGTTAPAILAEAVVDGHVGFTAAARAAEVAGYEKRIAITDFMLAGRLASVATLNSRAGRKPRVTGLPQTGAPIIPSSRIGAKKQRCAANGLRVLRAAALRPSAQIIAFPTARARDGARAARQARAA